MKTIEKTFSNGRQSVEYEGLYEYKGHKLKISIDIDSYDDQSSARVSVFNSHDFKWNILGSIPYGQMASLKKDDRDCKAVFYQTKVGDAEGNGLRWKERQAIDQDIDTLLTKAKKIL